MKRRLFTILALMPLALTALVSCQEKIVDPTVLRISSPGKDSADPHEKTITVLCDQKISASITGADWVKILSTTPVEESKYSVVVSFSMNESEAERSATLTIKSGSMTETATLKQSGIGSVVSEPNMVFAGVETKVLKITSKSAWKLQLVDTKGTPDWISVDKTEGKAGVTSVNVSTTQEYIDDSDRNCFGKILIGEEYFYVTFTQKPTNAILCDIDSKDIDVDGGEVTVQVAANVDFFYTLDVNWIKRASTKALKSTTVTFAVEANPDIVTREGHITFTNSDGSITETVTVYQATKDRIILSSDTLELPYYPGSKIVALRSNIEYELKCDSDWLKADFEEGRVDRIRLEIPGNTSSESRSANVVVSGVTRKDISATLVVTQTGKSDSDPFEQNTYGIFNITKAGDNIVFDKYAFQLGLSAGFFRIIDPNADRIIEISDIPSGPLSVGDPINLRVLQNWTGSMSKNTVHKMTVYKVDGDLVWAVDNNGIGFTFKR